MRMAWLDRLGKALAGFREKREKGSILLGRKSPGGEED